MSWLQSIDTALFRFINVTLANPVCDVVMAFLSGNAAFVPVVACLVAGLAWKGGVRGRVCAIIAALVVLLGDPLVCNNLKEAVARPRPFVELKDAHVRIGKTISYGLPSAHAFNWFAGTTVLFLYFRRSLWPLLPLAALVSFSRVYNGVHYPGDVLAGAILGTTHATVSVFGLDALWRRAGAKWFPLWWRKLPSLREPESAVELSPPRAPERSPPSLDHHWLRFGYVLIAAMLLARLGYLASDKIELSEDEAYQWLWSKHLALSYYSKPPLIACAQFVSTSLWGDNQFGVRFFSPVIASVLGFILLRFLAREANARTAFWMLPIVTSTPLLAVGATLMTVDPLSVLFWTAAMIAGWRAVQPEGRTGDWLWVGLWMGLGFLSKYTALFQLLCWVVWFACRAPARAHLRRPGPYLALAITGAAMLPVLLWNQQNGWPTIEHVASDGRLDQPWQPTLRYFWDFVGSEAALLNPVFFVAAVWAAFVFWKSPGSHPLQLYLLCMGAPLILFYLLLTLHTRVLPNWVAPAILPLWCLMTIYWDQRWRQGARTVKVWLGVGAVCGLTAVVLFHDTELIGRFTRLPLPPDKDPTRRVRGWTETAHMVAQARTSLLAEGKPAFIIGNHYGITSLLSFYLPEARQRVADDPLVYFLRSQKPVNQFYFWPDYRNRCGQNAIYVIDTRTAQSPPENLLREFESVTDLGLREVVIDGQTLHRVQLFACRNLL